MVCGLGCDSCLANLKQKAGGDHLLDGGSEKGLLLWCPGSGEVRVFSKDQDGESVTGVLLGLVQQACLKRPGDLTLERGDSR